LAQSFAQPQVWPQALLSHKFGTRLCFAGLKSFLLPKLGFVQGLIYSRVNKIPRKHVILVI